MMTVFFGVVLVFLSCSLAWAEDRVSCPTKSPYLMIEAGLRHVDKDGYAFPFGLRPDRSAGVEGAKLTEFNLLLGEKQPIILHCYPNKHDFWKEINAVDIILPPTISRCVQRDFKTPLECRSGSNACFSVETDYIEMQDNGQSVQLAPVKEKSGVLRWRDIDKRGAGKKLIAHCFHRYSEKSIEEVSSFELTPDMKECVLTAPWIDRWAVKQQGMRHLICTSTPDVHDNFWPKL
jgi:hypothetical protein